MAGYPPVDYSRFVWKAPKPDYPSYHSREVFACERIEALWNVIFNGQHNLFLGLHVTLSVPVSAADLLTRAREAWEALRFELPILDARVHNEEDAAYMSYRVAESSEEVKQWSKRTVRLAATGTDLEELRYEVGKIKLPEKNGEQTFLYVVPKSDTSYGFLLHTHHTPMDNAGAQITMDRFLKKLSRFMTNPSLASTDSVAWGNEHENLTPPITELLDEPREGPLHDQSLSQFLSGMQSLSRAVGFKNRNIGPGHTRYIHTEFSVDETTRFIQAVRELGGTVNQFAHAGLCIVTHLDNPTIDDTPEDPGYFTLTLENARSRLRPEHSKYPGYGLAFHPVFVPESVVSSTASRGGKTQLIEVAKVVKEEFRKGFKENPVLGGIMASVSDIMFPMLKTIHLQPPSLRFSYSGDGVAEKYLSYTFEDSYGKTTITLDDYFTSINMTNPGPFFRVNTWRGRLRLAADTNEFAMPPDVVQGFVDKWAQILKQIL